MRLARIPLFLAAFAIAAFAGYTFPTNPGSLGIVTVVTSGTPVTLVSSVAAAIGADVRCREITIEAIKTAARGANTGNVFVGTATMNKTTGAGVIKTLGIGGIFVMSAETNTLRPERLYLDATTNGDGAQVSCLVQ